MSCRSWKTLIAALAGAAALSVTGCNGMSYGGPSSMGSSMSSQPSATGIWGGTDSVTGLTVTGYIDSAGEAVFIRGDGVQFAGPAQLSGNTLVAAVVGYANFPSTFSDGSSYGLGTLNGTVASGSTLMLRLSFTTQNGTTESGSWSLTFNTLTDSGSSLGTIAASYTDTASGSTISIAGNGTITGRNPQNSCVVNGTITIVNSTYDIYQVTLSYSNCTGTYAALNGVELTGLAVYDPNTSPPLLTIEVAGATTTARFALVINLQGA
ncbi:MAG TPA: hypothetical protein VET46_10485 [Steroidobacteraceae bacterium]|nr:hypothetical protein [Steroidobacteraceae bacterium]